MRATSLRVRLLLGALAIATVFAVLFGALAWWRVHRAEDRAVTAALRTRVELARDEVAADGVIAQDAGSPRTDLVQVLGPDGLVRSSSSALRSVGPLVDARTVTSSGTESRVTLARPDADLAVLAVPLRLAGSSGHPAGTGTLVVAVDAEGFTTATSDLVGLLLGGLAVLVLAVGALAWALTGRALRTVARVAEDAEEVRASDLDEGLPVPRADAELRRLVESLNRMLARIHTGHKAELAFAAEAGHRLRTPVATLRAEAELGLRERDPDEVRASLRRVLDDADRLTLVVDRMLARGRSPGADSSPLVAGLADASERWHRQADVAGVRLRVTSELRPDTPSGELLSVVDPLVDNALRHTPGGGAAEVTVGLEPGTGHLVALVSNEGDPVPDDLVPHVFDAWVSTRDASVAGGLGLWLARQTSRNLGGDVELLPYDGRRTAFRVRLPVRPGPAGVATVPEG